MKAFLMGDEVKHRVYQVNMHLCRCLLILRLTSWIIIFVG